VRPQGHQRAEARRILQRRHADPTPEQRREQAGPAPQAVAERADTRALANTTGTARRAQAASRLGQISASTISSSAGRRRRNARATIHGRSNGA
jgi:hypothetical protein